jgi:hypothetical protein
LDLTVGRNNERMIGKYNAKEMELWIKDISQQQLLQQRPVGDWSQQKVSDGLSHQRPRLWSLMVSSW